MKRFTFGLLVLFLLLDTGFSFIQHSQFPLDGDMANIIVPDKNYEQVLHDPLGLAVLLDNESYAAPNRFFAHWFMSVYFKNIPNTLQVFTNPVDSIYQSSALIKTIIQIVLIYLLAVYICGRKRLLNPDLILAAAIITPVFQTFGYGGLMGIIDKSITYTFAYSLPLVFILSFLLPYPIKYYHNENKTLKTTGFLILIGLSFTIAFNGPLSPVIILMICPLIIMLLWVYNFNLTQSKCIFRRAYLSFININKQTLYIFIFCIILCMYSLWIGTHNSENQWDSISILERYSRLPRGIFDLITQKIGIPVLITTIVLNAIIIIQQKNNVKRHKILKLMMWIGIVSLIYIIILPLGGYREYRPNIIRKDTMIPVLIALIYIYGLSTFEIIKSLNENKKKLYVGWIVFLSAFFTIADAQLIKENECERKALQTIANSTEKIVKLNSDCTVMSWNLVRDYKHSDTNTELLRICNVISEEKYYYQTD